MFPCPKLPNALCVQHLRNVSSLTSIPHVPCSFFTCHYSIKEHLLGLLGSDGLLTIPSAPGPAFLNNQVDPEAFQQLRMASLSLTCIAGLAGLPQVREVNGSLEMTSTRLMTERFVF